MDIRPKAGSLVDLGKFDRARYGGSAIHWMGKPAKQRRDKGGILELIGARYPSMMILRHYGMRKCAGKDVQKAGIMNEL